MTFLPIVGRELRVAARRRSSYWSRFTAGLCGAGLCAWMIALQTGASPADMGESVFITLAAVVFCYTAVGGIQATSDCLSEERREGTLGLLFLTDLRAYDVVLGKLAASSINTFFGILAVVPALAIPILLGGVTNGEFWRTALVTFDLLFFFLATGLFASALSREDQKAIGLAIVVALFILLAGPLAGWWVSAHGHRIEPEPWCVTSPAMDCFIAYDKPYVLPGMASWFWVNVAVTQCYALILFGLACLIARRSWNELEKFGGPRKFSIPGARTLSARAADLRKRLLAVNPYLWRAGADNSRRRAVWLLLMSMGVLYVWWTSRYQRWEDDIGILLLLLFVSNFVVKCWIALEAARCFASDRRSGGLELLLSTPLTEAEIVWGQRQALWRIFGPPVGALLVAHFLALLGILDRASSTEDRNPMVCICVFEGVFLVLDIMAVGWLSMWFALRGRKPNRAALLSVVLIIILPTLVYWLGVSLVALVVSTGPAGDLSLFGFFSAAGILAGATDLGLMAMARMQLLEKFRAVVAQGDAKPPPSETRASAPAPPLPDPQPAR